jgi:hypothetical protein
MTVAGIGGVSVCPVRGIWVHLLVDESIAGCVAIDSKYIYLVSAAFAKHLLYELLYVSHSMPCLVIVDVVDASSDFWQAGVVDGFSTGG